GSAIAAEPPPFTVESSIAFERPAETHLRMPTDIAIAPSGDVFVADGVHDRIVQFSTDGRFIAEISTIGEQKLARPVGVDVDAQGRIWIADTGNGRVIVRAPVGG